MTVTPLSGRTMLVDFHWQAVAAGLFVALGIHIVLTAFGLGVALLMGTSAVLWPLLWSGGAWIVASFIGGYVTAWVADAVRYPQGLFHGLVLWGVLTFLLMFLPPSTMGVGATGSDVISAADAAAAVAWFVAIGGFLSLGTAIWGTSIGSRVVDRVEARSTDHYRAA